MEINKKALIALDREDLFKRYMSMPKKMVVNLLVEAIATMESLDSKHSIKEFYKNYKYNPKGSDWDIR